MQEAVLEFLSKRHSTPISALAAPGPDEDQLQLMLKLAARVPDHGRLTPWRFIIYRGDARKKVGQLLADRLEQLEGSLTEARKEQELKRFDRAPLVVGVVSSPVEHPRIPEWEMFLSAGAAAMNLCHAANAMGFASNWITNWYANEEEGRRLLGIAPHERVAGFVHIGTSQSVVPERPRADMEAKVSEYQGPWSE
ncbi:nitroreductase [Paenochrobactrum glaciei]|uniref:Putative NAD(P)H nitroreductase n=1 Tax=Paenochrobactrum glaciei TaxID=486407 RepID=A0ABP3QIH7_9HYPH